MEGTAILLVDDEKAIVELLETVLRKEGYTNIDTARTGEAAIEACQRKAYDLIVLDVMLPGRSGVEICPFIRVLTDAPILFLTARSSDFDKLTGFAIGGDDYITKPFNPLEVVARIKAQLRRYLAPGKQAGTGAAGSPAPGSFATNSGAPDEDDGSPAHGKSAANNSAPGKGASGKVATDKATPDKAVPDKAATDKAALNRFAPAGRGAAEGRYSYGRFSIDELTGELCVAGQPVACPALVFQLLLFFCKHPNRIFSKSELYERVWDEQALSDDNTVMVHIHRIRERIEEDPANPHYLVNVRGLGYKLVWREERAGRSIEGDD